MTSEAVDAVKLEIPKGLNIGIQNNLISKKRKLTIPKIYNAWLGDIY
jgi:hypothetical protein